MTTSFAILLVQPTRAFSALLVSWSVLLLQVSIAAFFNSDGAPNLSLIDIATTTLVLGAVLSGGLSTYKFAAIRPVTQLMCAAFLYFTFRFASELAVRIQLFMASVVTTLLGLSAITNFGVGFAKWESYHFSDAIPFRRLISPFSSSIAPGTTLAIFLALLALSTSSMEKKFTKLESMLSLVSITLMCACIYLSFSRALYISAAVFLVCYGTCRHAQLTTKSSLLFTGGLALLVCVGLWQTHILRPGIETIRLWTTSSQQRSVVGRVEAARMAVAAAAQHPLWGGGPGTFPFIVSSQTQLPGDTPFFAQTFNLFLQVAAEEGAIGVVSLCFLALAALIGWRSCYPRSGSVTESGRTASALFFGFVSLLVYSLAEASLLNNSILTVVTFTILGLLAREETSVRQPSRKALRNYLPASICVAVGAFGLPLALLAAQRDVAVERFADRTATTSDYNAPELGFAGIAKTDAYLPLVKAISRAQGLDILQQPMARYIEGDIGPASAEGVDLEAIKQLISQAVQANPMDGSLWSNQAWLELITGDKKRALESSRTALRYASNDHLVFASAGMIFDSTGNYDNATKAYTTAIILSPRIIDSEFFQELTDRQPVIASKVIQAATQSLKQDFDRTSSPVVASKLAKLLFSQGQLEPSRVLLRDALQKLPNLEGAWLNLGESYRVTGDVVPAIDCYRKAAYIGSIDPIPFCRLGEALVALGHSNGGIQSLLISETDYGRSSTEHSDRVWLMYRPTVRLRNDMLPTTLLGYLSPLPGPSGVYGEIAGAYYKLGERELARQYEDCSHSTRKY